MVVVNRQLFDFPKASLIFDRGVRQPIGDDPEGAKVVGLAEDFLPRGGAGKGKQVNVNCSFLYCDITTFVQKFGS